MLHTHGHQASHSHNDPDGTARSEYQRSGRLRFQRQTPPPAQHRDYQAELYDQAREQFGEVLKVSPGHSEGSVYLGALLAEQKKYDLGTSVIFFVLDAQTRLVNAEAALVNQTVLYRRNLLNLLRVTGELLDERGIKVQ